MQLQKLQKQEYYLTTVFHISWNRGFPKLLPILARSGAGTGYEIESHSFEIIFKSNLVPSSLRTRLRHGSENSGVIEFLDLILDIRLHMHMLSSYSY